MAKIVQQEGGWFKLRVDTAIYSLAAVYAAAYVFLEMVYVYLDSEKSSGNKIVVWLLPKKNLKDNQENFGLEFYNELLNYAHYYSSLTANADALKALMQRALFSAAPPLIKEMHKKQAEELIEDLAREEKTGPRKRKIPLKK